MISTLSVERHVHVSDRTFEAVVAAFQTVTGSVEEGFDKVAAGLAGREAFTEAFRAREGSSGFMRFLPVDHGKWLATFDQPAKALMYVLGNPLIAVTMLKHDVAAGLHVPVRLYIFEDDDRKTRVVYDLPSTLMGDLDDPALIAAAKTLDAKLTALAETISGVPA